MRNIENQIRIVDLQGLLIGGTVEDLEDALASRRYDIELTCVEAIQLDNDDEFIDAFTNSYTTDQWRYKLEFAREIEAELYLIIYQNGIYYKCLIDYDDNTTPILMDIEDLSEKSFIKWWKSRKKTIQTKIMYEARPRQGNTIFDRVLEGNGVKWGGNVDSILFNNHFNVSAIVENRCSSRQTIDKYDPNTYFFGTKRKSGDYMTWLPLFYLSKKLNVPLLLFTFSRIEQKSMGVSIVESMERTTGLIYSNYPPNINTIENVEDLITWLNETIEYTDGQISY